MSIGNALYYIRDNGVCDETAYPFVDNPSANYCRSDSIIPNEIVQFVSFNTVGNSSEDAIKQAIIANGPLISGFMRGTSGHAICLSGYGILNVGDTIRGHANGWNGAPECIQEGDPRIGKTVWHMKNSYGLTQYPEHQG